MFAKGTGVFYLGGNWQANVIKTGLKDSARFMNMPPGPSGKDVAIGSTSLPWHISSKSKYPDVGAALINWLIFGTGLGPAVVRPNQIPAVLSAPSAKGDAYLSSVANGWKWLFVKSNGLTLFPDWASTDMLTGDGAGLPEDDRGASERQRTLRRPFRTSGVKFDKTHQVSDASRQASAEREATTTATRARGVPGRAARGRRTDRQAARRAAQRRLPVPPAQDSRPI